MSSIVTIRKGIRAADEIADIIANPTPDRPFANAIGAAGRKMCDGWSSVQPWTAGFIGGALPGPLAGSAILNTVCKPYLDSVGADAPVIGPPPFSGGQCEGVQYVVVGTGEIISTFNGSPSNSWTTYTIVHTSGAWPLGPIDGYREFPASPTVNIFTAGTNDIPVAREGQGGTVNVYVDNFVSSGAVRWGRNFQITSITPRFAGEDVCGDPEGILEPGQNPRPSPGPFPPGEEPGIDPTGQPFFFVPDIEDPFGDIPIGDEPFDPPLGPASGGDGLPGDEEAIGDEAGEVTGGDDGGDIDFGEPPEGRIWIGCIVETSSIGAVGNIAGTGPLSTVWPTVRANAALNYGSKKGTNNRINSKFTDLIRSSTSLIVTGVFLQVLPGSTAKVFPLSALICPDNPCSEE